MSTVPQMLTHRCRSSGAIAKGPMSNWSIHAYVKHLLLFIRLQCSVSALFVGVAMYVACLARTVVEDQYTHAYKHIHGKFSDASIVYYDVHVYTRSCIPDSQEWELWPHASLGVNKSRPVYTREGSSLDRTLSWQKFQLEVSVCVSLLILKRVTLCMTVF